LKIAVIHGSPTGPDSVTLQYLRFLGQQLPELSLEILDVGRGGRRLEKDRRSFDALISRVVEADGLLWSFPVYTFLAPANLVRFVEHLFERLPPGRLAGRVASLLTTSEHFFDHSAHNWLEEVSEDLGMSVFKGFSARTEELLAEDGRRNLLAWAREMCRCIAEKTPLESHHVPVSWTPPVYAPALGAEAPKSGRSVTLVTDCREGDTNLARMIDVFRHHVAHPVDVLNLHEIRMKGGCMGCLQCVYDGTCVYKDGFADAFDQRIRAADVLVFAGTIRHRYFSSTFKAYFDRNFRNGHRPVLHGKPMGWLVSGPLRQLPNLRQILEAKNEVQGSPRLGIVTDEYADDDAITARIVEMARAVDRLTEHAWIRPATFLGVGGRKIFRDLMWTMRGIVRADHAYYRREGLYDFPQRDLRRTLFNWTLGAMMALPCSRRWVLRNLGRLKIAAFREVVKVDPQREARSSDPADTESQGGS
jgi:multimeric flavodoxin WrbA